MKSPDTQVRNTPSIDLRTYPKDKKTALPLRRTPTDLSFGIVYFPRGYKSVIKQGESLIAFLPEDVDPEHPVMNEIVFNMKPSSKDEMAPLIEHVIHDWISGSPQVGNPFLFESASVSVERDNIQPSGVLFPVNQLVGLYIRYLSVFPKKSN